MSFQTSVRYDWGLGVPGELIYDGPSRAQAGFIQSASAAYNIIGATAFTQPAAGGAVKAGGTGIFFGILANPKTAISFGNSSDGPLGTTLTLPNNVEGSFVQMGYLLVSVPAACSIGDQLYFDQTTGALGTINPIITATASQTTTVVTVTAITAGNIGVGSVLQGPTGVPVTVKSLGTGTGGVGTYNVDSSQSVSSGAYSGSTVAPSGITLIAGGFIDKFPQSGAGVAVARLSI